jgi:hypothetical protein
MRRSAFLLALLLAALPAAAQPQRYVEGQRELGPIVVRELAIRDGRLVFRVDSGGCTDATSFAVDVVKVPGISAAVPHYRLTIRRVRADDCKALLLEGVLIELDLAKDLGLAGRFTVSVENPVLADTRGST